jgi:hypothetical protein
MLNVDKEKCITKYMIATGKMIGAIHFTGVDPPLTVFKKVLLDNSHSVHYFLQNISCL